MQLLRCNNCGPGRGWVGVSGVAGWGWVLNATHAHQVLAPLPPPCGERCRSSVLLGAGHVDLVACTSGTRWEIWGTSRPQQRRGRRWRRWAGDAGPSPHPHPNPGTTRSTRTDVDAVGVVDLLVLGNQVVQVDAVLCRRRGGAGEGTGALM